MRTIRETLTAEHRELERLLTALDRSLEPLDAEGVHRAADDLARALSLHRRKEEELFPVLRAHSVVHPDALATIEHEHSLEQTIISEIRTVAKASIEDPSFTRSLVENARRMIVLLKDHMWREEQFIFGWAERILPEEEKARILDRMESLKSQGGDEMNAKPKRILVPLDGSPEAEAILKAVTPILKSAFAEVGLLSVIDEGEASTQATEYLDRIARGLQLQGIRATFHLRTGDPAREILDFTAGGGADLIAMTTHGRSGFSRLLTGSVTEEVLRHAAVPVLVCRPDTGLQVWKRAVVALDGSARSEEILPEAAWVCRRMRIPADVVKVAHPVVTGGGIDTEFASPTPAENVLPYLQEACGRLSREDVVARAFPLLGAPAAEIIRHARESGASLICMTTHGRTGLTRLLLGSIAEEVLRHAPCPVLVRRTAEAARPVEHRVARM